MLKWKPNVARFVGCQRVWDAEQRSAEERREGDRKSVV